MLHAQAIAPTPVAKTSKAKNKKKPTSEAVATSSVIQTQTLHTQSSAITHIASSGNSFTHEFQTSLTTGGFTSQKRCSNCDSNTTFNVQISYLHFLQEKIQIGGELAIDNNSYYGTSNTYLTAMGVAAYNFQNDLNNAFFTKIGLGFFTIPKGTSTETKLGFFLGGGKRFQWLPNINYSPELRIVKKGDLDVGFEFSLLNFGIHWN